MRHDVQQILDELGYYEIPGCVVHRVFMISLPTAVGAKNFSLCFRDDLNYIFSGHYYSEGRNVVEAEFPEDLSELDENGVLMFFHKIYQKIHQSYARKLHVEHSI